MVDYVSNSERKGHYEKIVNSPKVAALFINRIYGYAIDKKFKDLNITQINVTTESRSHK